MRKQFAQWALAGLSLSLPLQALSPGDSVALEAVSSADFIQGEAPGEWKEGEVYIFECWATWCGPCIAAIPHVDELFDTFHEEGLHIYGMNVWEEGKEKVSGFVEKKGDGMSYPVAYVGRGGAFEESWLKAAGVTGIPHAFVVKNGKLLFTTHPASLHEDTIKGLLAGGDEETAVIEKVLQEQKNKELVTEKIKAFRLASKDNDLAAMQAAYDAIAELSPGAPYLPSFQLDLKIAAEDWSAAAELLANMDEAAGSMVARQLAFQYDDPEGEVIPDSLRKAILQKVQAAKAPHFYDGPITARLQWLLGDKELAKETATGITSDKVPAGVIEDFAGSFATDTPHSLQDFSKALNLAMREQQAQKAAEQ
ncbi:redoxin family protein [Roseibacillus ishigakijimensis]|uniref:Redoxin domain-containing protein n=1 Tax=Roseibacillus ishigakijimensis TaxID=454146 RepID=A0A934VK08_9BACT|nr:redoxin family protein [Roseibacillus ishigakijimensis]MBK1833164.1 redoxin domain-containing protein [Roseibacillus ishigakijimensis]